MSRLKSNYSFIPFFLLSFIFSFLILSQRRTLDFPKRVFQTALSTASSFNFQYSLVSLRSSCGCLCILRVLPVNYDLPSAIWCFIRRFLSQIWPIKLYVLLFIECKLLTFFLPMYNAFSFAQKDEQNELPRPPPVTHFNPLQEFLICFLKCAMFNTVNISCCKCSSLPVSSKN